MVHRYVSWLLSAALLSLLPYRSQAQTTLQTGELLFVGYDAQDPDDYAFTPLVDLAAGTQIRFTDNGWLPTGGFRATEGICVYTAPAVGVPRGTVVSFRADSLCFTHPGRFQLATDGDQLLAYQGPDAAPVFICGLAFKKNWSSVVSSNTSALPPGLTDGSSALYLPWANGAYAPAQARTGTAASLRAALASAASWAGSNTARTSWPLTPFTFAPTYLAAPPAGVDSLRLDQYHTFAHLDVSQVPTGLLAEYGMPFVPPAVFDGTLTDSSRTNDGVFRQLFATLATSRVYGPNAFPRLDTLMDRLDRRAAAPDGAIPIAIERIDYAALRPDAITAGLLTWQNNQLYDVPGRTQSPYLLRTVFVAGPARTYSRTGNITLVVPLAQHVQSGGGVAQTPEIDFGDGRGYLPAAWDQPITAAYCDSGTHRVKLRLAYVLAGAPTMTYESHFDLEVLHPGCGSARYASGGPDLNFPMAGYTDAGSGGKVSIRYGGNHTQIVKPLIVVEGYDPDFIADKLGKGNYSVDNFLENIRAIDVSNVLGVPDFNFRNALDDANPFDPNRPVNYVAYDIIFIDFKNGTDDIRRNARLFKEVVRWVNANKQPNPFTQQLEQNVVLGISMGGLVARYGLAQMEKAQSNSTNTRLLITQDSPHRGANTPLGAQALARQAYNAANILTFTSSSIGIATGLVLRAILPHLDQAIALENAPATRQLLLLYAEDGSGTTTTDGFLTGDYRNTITFPAGGPQPPYRFIANSLGSQCGTGTLVPYSELARVEGGAFMKVGSFLKADYRMSFVLNALPRYAASQRVSGLRLFVNYKVFGVTVATHTLFSQSFASPANVPNWDGAPGGTQDLSSRLPLEPGAYPPLDLWITGGDLNIQAVEKFCFVPTVSALDINDINSATINGRYVNGVASSSFSRAANFMAQPTLFTGQANYEHPFFLGRQAHWLFNEMEQANLGPNVAACSNECVTLTIASTLAPLQRLCQGTSATFSIPGLQPGATVTWSAPSGYFTPTSGTGSTFTVSAVNGMQGNSGTITAIVGPCNTPVSVLVPVGAGEPTGVYSALGQNTVVLQTVQHVTPNNNYLMTMNEPYDFTFTSSTTAITVMKQGPRTASFAIPANLIGGGFQINVISTNAPCGSLSAPFVFMVGSQRFAPGYKPTEEDLTLTYEDPAPTATLYPNPARETVDVHIENPDAAHPVTVRLFDSYGQLRTEQASAGAASVRLKTDQLPEGLYFVHILRGSEVLSRQQLRIEK